MQIQILLRIIYNYKNTIKKVNASGGDDTPEDVAWALEMSLNKNWKNNARFVILIADAPLSWNKISWKKI